MKLSKFCNKISLILQALWCAVLYFLIEALCRHSVVEAWDAVMLFVVVVLISVFQLRVLEKREEKLG